MQYREKKQQRYQILFIGAAVVIFAIVLAVTVILMLTIDDKLKGDAEEQVRTFTEQAAGNAIDHVILTERVIEAFTVQSAEAEKIQEALYQLKKNFDLAQVFFVDLEGNGITAEGEVFFDNESLQKDIIFQSGSVQYTAFYECEEDVYAYRLKKMLVVDGVEIGAIYADVYTDNLVGEKQFTIFDGEGFFFLFDARTGVMVTEPADVFLPVFQESRSLYDFLNELERHRNVSSSFDSTHTEHKGSYIEQFEHAILYGEECSMFMGSVGGAESYICILPVDNENLYICGIISEESVRSEATSVSTIFIFVFAILFACLIAMLIMSLLFYRRRAKEGDIERKTLLYGALSDSLDMAINTYSPETATVNPIVAKAREIIGYPMAELMSNRGIADIIKLSDEGRSMFERIRQNKVHELKHGEFSFKKPTTGELRHVAYSITPFFYENREQILVVFRDVTNEKNLQLSMQDAMVAAETANRAKSDFLSRMSHEIRTPMNAIMGMIQIAQKGIDNEEKVIASLEKINLASDHLLNLINDVLDISKIESGKMILANTEFNYLEVMNNVATVIRMQSEQKGQQFIFEIGEVIDEVFIGDRMRLQQVLINLLTNAVKYTPEGGQIRFTVTQKPSKVNLYIRAEFVIQDTGIGMSEEYLEHLFEPFVMEGRSQEQGTGLGMPIVKNIMTMVNGDIQVESKLGEGTKFTVSMNLKRTEGRVDALSSGGKKEDSEEIASKVEPLDITGIRVLLAEDNDMNAEIASELLADANVITERAENGEAACRMFADSQPGYYQAILMDIQMPVMDGYVATECIRALDHEDAQRIPIIAMSANAFIEDEQASLRSGMNAHLSKPIDIRKVLATLAQYVREAL